MDRLLLLPAPGQSLALAQPADPDAALIALWLHGRGPHTLRAYRQDLARLRAHCPQPLAAVTLGDLQSFSDSLTGAIASKLRALSAVKSLLRFAARTGYLQFDVGQALRCPQNPGTLATRILSESEAHRIIAAAVAPRDKALVMLLYAAGLRISEACGLRWRDVAERGNGGGQVNVLGKGSKPRSILLPASVYSDLLAIRGDAADDAPVFRSRQGNPLSVPQAERIIKAMAVAAGVKKNVSPHWFRHACASHSLDRGAPIHVVQATLGHASLAVTSTYAHCRPDDSAGMYLGL